jgi:hypothetical protein
VAVGVRVAAPAAASVEEVEGKAAWGLAPEVTEALARATATAGAETAGRAVAQASAKAATMWRSRRRHRG